MACLYVLRFYDSFRTFALKLSLERRISNTACPHFPAVLFRSSDCRRKDGNFYAAFFLLSQTVRSERKLFFQWILCSKLIS
jgi:hypothetical protein